MTKELYTDGSSRYTFFEITKGSLQFQVQTNKEAYVALTSSPNGSGQMYEIIIGNSKSYIRRDQRLPNKAEVYTPNILPLNVRREFWIKWNNGNITVGQGGLETPFLQCNDLYPLPIGYYGVKTEGRNSGIYGYYPPSDWLIEGTRSITTSGKSGYQFHPLPHGAITFDVCCQSEAHIALISSPSTYNHEHFPMIEVFIGASGNTRTALRRDRREPCRISSATPDILSSTTLRRFRLLWNNGKVSLMPGYASSMPILEYYERNPLGVTHFGMRTTFGLTGHWRIKEGDEPDPVAVYLPPPTPNVVYVAPPTPTVVYAPPPTPTVVYATPKTPNVVYVPPPVPTVVHTSPPSFPEPVIPPIDWVKVTAGRIPQTAFIGGRDHASILYVGRAYHQGDLIPGKINPQYKLCYIPYGGKEIEKDDYQVLCGTNLQWISSSGNNIPANAVKGGNTSNQELLYIGRAIHNGVQAVGKVHPSHGTCYISYGGKEHGYSSYEILVHKH